MSRVSVGRQAKPQSKSTPRPDEGWTTFLLVAGMQVCLGLAVSAAAWTDGLSAAPMVAFLATLTGWSLAKSRFRGLTATAIAAVYGLFLLGLILGLQVEPDLWLARVNEVLLRVVAFVAKLIGGGTSRDNLIFVALVMTVAWVFGVSAAWSVYRRGRVWQAILPAGLVLLNNVYYYNGPARMQSFVVAYVLLVLLLLARTHLHQHEVEWQAERVAFSTDLRFDFFRAGLLVSAIVLMAAWWVPASAASPDVASIWNRMAGPWQTVRENFIRLFSSLRAYSPASVDYYGESLILSGAVDLSGREVMQVFVAPRGELGRYYWRARVYDRYNDGRWSTGATERRLFVPEQEEFQLPTQRARDDVLFDFVSGMDAMQVLYVTSQFKWADRPADLQVVRGVAAPVDVVLVRSQKIVNRGEGYSLLASVSLADEQSLREAGDNYPDWVRTRYLQLSSSTSDRTRELAAQITRDAATPYDKATAIADWLRANIKYNQKIETSPAGADPVDWFLFDYREGYCDYYASAMVVMLRSLGIPSRLAVGFAEGGYDSELGAYRVRQSDAHAWPEVFFPGFGWVEFEPTASQAPIRRPAEPLPVASPDSDPAADEEPLPSDEQEREERLDRDALSSSDANRPDRLDPRWLWAGAAAVGALVVLALAWWLAEYAVAGRNPARLLGAMMLARGLQAAGLRVPARMDAFLASEAATFSPALLAYARLLRGARWLGLKLTPAHTPFERAQALAAALPDAEGPAQAIAGEYVAERFGRAPGDGHRALAAWSALRLKLWGGGLERRVRRVFVGGTTGDR